MKKVFSLILALALVLTAVSALAAEGSKGTDDTFATGVIYPKQDNTNYSNWNTSTATDTTPTSEILKEDSELTKELKAALAADGIKALPEEVQALIPDGLATINEIITYKLDNVAAGVKLLTINYVFPTKYAPAGEKVAVIFVVEEANGEKTYLVAEGTIQDNGSINVTLTEEILKAIVGKTVSVIVVSK